MCEILCNLSSQVTTYCCAFFCLLTTFLHFDVPKYYYEKKYIRTATANTL